MGNINKPAKKETKQESPDKPWKGKISTEPRVPLDPTLVRWLTRDINRIEGYPPPNEPQSLTPPDHCVQYMKLYGWMDLDLNDPDLAPLFK